MTESEWHQADLNSKLEFLWGAVSERKLRLFACACCRSIWDYIEGRPAQRLVEIAEKCADGQANRRELADAQRQLTSYIKDDPEGTARDPDTAEIAPGLRAAQQAGAPRLSLASLCEAASHAVSAVAADDDFHEWDDGTAAADELHREESQQLKLLTDIIGNPFRPETVAPRYLSATVVSLARAIYDERQFQNLPILADALEDAGCDHAVLMRHCREPGVHARGCWAIDAILARE